MSRDSYYKRLKRGHCRQVDEAMIIKFVLEERIDQPRVGTLKLKDLLYKKKKRFVGRDKLFTILRKRRMLVKPKKSYKKTTYSRHGYAVAPNRIKGLEVIRPRQVLVSDITYLRLSGGKFAYLFLVTDLYSRMIVGYHLSRDLSHYSALLALDNAVQKLGDVENIIHHSDRGCQYCCHQYLDYLAKHKMLSSMTDEAHCYQNAVAERVNGTLKVELELDQVFDSFTQLQHVTAKTIMVYNTKRTHWSLDLKTPMEVYEKAA
jgi:putative transposase